MNEPRTTDPELMEMYLEAEAQFGDDYFWTKHGHAAFLAERRTPCVTCKGDGLDPDGARFYADTGKLPACPDCGGHGVITVAVEGPDTFGNYDTAEVKCQRCFTGPWQRCPLCGEYFGMDLHNGPCSDCDPNR